MRYISLAKMILTENNIHFVHDTLSKVQVLQTLKEI